MLAAPSFINGFPGRRPRRLLLDGHANYLPLRIAPDLQSKVDAVTGRESLSRAALLTVWINKKRVFVTCRATWALA